MAPTFRARANDEIGTAAPRTTLEVAGDLIVASSTNLNINNPAFGYGVNNIAQTANSFNTVINGQILELGGISIVIGGLLSGNTSGANFNTVIGPGSVTKITGPADNSTVLGRSAQIASSSRSTAIGYGASVTQSHNTVAIGDTNASITLGGDYTPVGRLNIKATSTSATGYALNIFDSVSASLLRLTNAGNLGIATTSPYAKLSVTNTGAGPSFVVEDDTSPDTTPFLIDASGNVGIGTTNPTKALTVEGAMNFLSSGVLRGLVGTPRGRTTTYQYRMVRSLKAPQTPPSVRILSAIRF